MTYSKEKPKLPGYYWIKSENIAEQIVEIIYSDIRGLVVLWMGNDEDPELEEIDLFIDCEWKGPILPKSEEIIIEKDEDDFGILPYRYYSCPKCKMDNISRNFKFCPLCGNKIKWI